MMDRERERDWDDRPVSIKRYVIPSEEDRREFVMRRDDPYSGDRELVIRRKSEREEPVSVQRYDREVDYDRRYDRDYERDYYEREYSEPYAHRRYSRSVDYLERPEQRPAPIIIREQPVIVHEARNVYVNSRESDYDIVRRSDADDDAHYYRHRRVDRLPRRELSPGDSVSQASRRRGDRDQDYSSDDSMVYIRKETRDHDGDHPHHRRHLAEGALVGAGAAELFRSHRKREGEDVSHGLSHLGKTVGAGALGAVAVNAASHARDYYRSKSRHRSHSFDDDRSYRHSRHSRGGRSRSRSRSSHSRSHSHSRAKTLMELGLGAAAVAAGVAALRNKSKNDERRSRSRTRTRSRSRARASSTARSDQDEARSVSQRRKHMAGAGLAGAAVAGLVEHARSRSRSRRGERSRSHSRLRKALPVVAAGLGTAAATGYYEKKKAEKEGEGVSRERHRSRSHSRGPPEEMYPDPARDSAGLIEYGKGPVTGSIPAEHYYGQPASPGPAYYSDGANGYGARRPTRSRSRSRSRGGRYSGSSSGSDREERRRHRSKKHRSRSRELAGAALGATGLGYAAHKYQQRKDRKKADQEHERHRYDDDAHRDPYEESYDPEPYPPSPHANAGAHPADGNYYPNSNYFPPPPGSTTNLGASPTPYNPAEYPPPPGAAPPPQPYSYGAAGQGPETYAPRPRRADENVSAAQSSTLPTAPNHTRDGLDSRSHRRSASVSRSASQPVPSKSVAFDLGSEHRHPDPGYETDDSDSTIDSYGGSRRRRQHDPRRHSSSVPHPPMPHPRPPDPRHGSSTQQHSSEQSQNLYKSPEQDSDSTIDLPDRFDAQGRLLPEREDPAVEKFENLVNQFSRVLF